MVFLWLRLWNFGTTFGQEEQLIGTVYVDLTLLCGAPWASGNLTIRVPGNEPPPFFGSLLSSGIWFSDGSCSFLHARHNCSNIVFLSQVRKDQLWAESHIDYYFSFPCVHVTTLLSCLVIALNVYNPVYLIAKAEGSKGMSRQFFTAFFLFESTMWHLPVVCWWTALSPFICCRSLAGNHCGLGCWADGSELNAQCMWGRCALSGLAMVRTTTAYFSYIRPTTASWRWDITQTGWLTLLHHCLCLPRVCTCTRTCIYTCTCTWVPVFQWIYQQLILYWCCVKSSSWKLFTLCLCYCIAFILP